MAESLLYITLGTNDISRATRFYDAALAPLGYSMDATEEGGIGYCQPDDRRIRLWIVEPYDGKPATIGNGSMVALSAPSQAAVDAFHRAALAASGSDEGAPGLRPYSPTFYAAYVRDPDGNKLSAVHGA